MGVGVAGFHALPRQSVPCGLRRRLAGTTVVVATTAVFHGARQEHQSLADQRAAGGAAVAIACLHDVHAGRCLLDAGVHITAWHAGLESVWRHRGGPDSWAWQSRTHPRGNRFTAHNAGAYNWCKGRGRCESGPAAGDALRLARRHTGDVIEPGTAGLGSRLENQRELTEIRNLESYKT